MHEHLFLSACCEAEPHEFDEYLCTGCLMHTGFTCAICNQERD